jgi:RNA polymerase sigma-70 factor (sigma-E family)
VRRDRGFEELELLLAARGKALLATAVLLTGRRETGEDLLQHALERVMRQWHRIEGDPEGYVRRTMCNLATDRWRRLGRRREVLAEVPVVSVGDHADEVDLRDALVRALVRVSPQQRAVLVLRYWEQLSEAEIADTLGCSVGTVKSAASRGLKRLREITDADLELPVGKG